LKAAGFAALTHKTTFSRRCPLPNFRHPFMSVRCLDERPRNDKKWDKPVIPMQQVERQLLSEADVRRLSARRGITTEAGPVSD
jgi:hypothetical protein